MQRPPCEYYLAKLPDPHVRLGISGSVPDRSRLRELLRVVYLEDYRVTVSEILMPAAEVSDSVRAIRAAVATAAGFTVANIFCWLMNRLFVFRPGRYRWYAEFGFFFGVAALATVVALGVQSALIKYAGMMTTLAVIVEVVVSFFFNFFIKMFIFL